MHDEHEQTNDTPENNGTDNAAAAEFEELIQGRCKELFQARVQKILEGRLRTLRRENELLHRLVTQILTWQTEIPVKKEDNLASKLLEIRGFLDEYFTEKISLDELANQFYISKYHMSREFKKAFGITVGSYVNSQRITKAKELLRFSDQQIEAIARACGIDDNSYFNKVFQKAEGITAREYRRKWRGQ